MRTKIWSVLSGALLLSACGAKVVGDDLPACQPGELTDFELPQALTGLEVRSNLATAEDVQNAAWSLRVIGESCATTSCAAEVAAVDAHGKGWTDGPNQRGNFVRYLIGMNEGSLVGSATSDAELVQLIGPIDTVAEAELVVALKGMGCERAGEGAGSLQVVSTEMINSCPIRTQQVLYRIDADASLHELERGDEEESDACAGRRPAGLAPRQPVPSSSPIGDYLARSAELEAASVVAFQVLEAELRAHGAPQALLDRAHEAAADEVMHARLVQRLAERFGGQVSARSIRVAPVRDLETVALENSVEGCVAETWGCLLGMHQAEHAQDALLRRAYRRIATDEARHAQLSWDVAEWAEQQLDSAARERIAQRRAEAVQKLAHAVTHPCEPEAVREALGLPDAVTSRRLFAHVNDALWS